MNQAPFAVAAQAWALDAERDHVGGQATLLTAATNNQYPIFQAQLAYEALRLGAPQPPPGRSYSPPARKPTRHS